MPLLLAVALATLLALQASAEIDNGTAVEGCIGCHSAGTALPVGNVGSIHDAHYVDQDPDGPRSAAGYRQLQIEPSSVDVTGTSVVVEYRVTDEDGAGVTNLFASDGRLTVSELSTGAMFGDPTEWQAFVRGERFTSSGAVFENLGGGNYRYTSVFDPTSVPVASGDTLRVALQISASDLPAGNGWCDFDANLSAANACPGSPSLTRDIIPTETCNGCHGVTSDVKLAFHGGGRTEVEYCVTCHNPGIGETDMTPMTHKIHYGANLTEGFRRWSDVNFTRDVDNCTACHMGGGADEDNWATVPNRVACGSCHDDVDFDTGENHGSGGAQVDNRFCANCHPAVGPWTPSQLPVSTVHQGVARATEAGRYRGGPNGYSIDGASYDVDTDQLTIDYSVVRDGVKMDLRNDPAWTMGGSLRLLLAWSSEEIRNTGSESAPAPAQPIRIDALDIGNAITDLGGGDYRAVVDRPEGASGVLQVLIEGRPVADLDVLPTGEPTEYTRLPVQMAVSHVSLELRRPATARRAVIDIAKCNSCHDDSGAGLSFHGTNRTLQTVSCSACHNGDATDIARRPADPNDALDGKREETIDIKRMIHGIHTGENLFQGLVLYGFGGNPTDFSHVSFLGNNENCRTCHLPGTYSTEDASVTTSSTIDTSTDVTDPADDLRISRIAAACSSCHDDGRAQQHMVLNGASFMALEENILMAPEPSRQVLVLAALAALTLMQRHRARWRRG